MTSDLKNHRSVEKLATGIPGFDAIAKGGLPKSRTTLLAGSAGSAKTIFATQFLAEGIRLFKQAGVFVTFEESPADIRRNMISLGWDIGAWEQQEYWVFVDASPIPGETEVVAGEYDLGALLVRIETAIKRVSAQRLVMDSLASLFSYFENNLLIRNEIFRISAALKLMGITAIMTAERSEEYGKISRFGVEEFVTDNVIILRNVLDEEKRRRTLELLKFRGTDHQKGEYPFTVLPDKGIVVVPLSAIELKQRSSNTRITSGIDTLDAMCGGGFFRDSIILVSGATGCGKTLTSTEFIGGGAASGERSLLLAFEESRDQLSRNASGWGKDFEDLESRGLLKVIAVYPESKGLEDHLVAIKEAIEEFQPSRVAVDSLSALERVATIKGFREFVIGLTSFIKHHEIAGLFTATTSQLIGGESITEAQISTITDSIILLRYVEMFGEITRGITVLKMRGSAHDKEIREFFIDASGMHIGQAFRNVTGILTGNPHHVAPHEIQRLETLFSSEEKL